MLLPGESPEQVPGFPLVGQYLRVLGFVADLLRQAAVVLVRVRKHDPTNVREPHSVLGQLRPQSVGGFFRFRPNVDQRHRVLFDEVNIYVADIKRGRDGERDDLHSSKVPCLSPGSVSHKKVRHATYGNLRPRAIDDAVLSKSQPTAPEVPDKGYNTG